MYWNWNLTVCRVPTRTNERMLIHQYTNTACQQLKFIGNLSQLPINFGYANVRKRKVCLGVPMGQKGKIWKWIQHQMHTTIVVSCRFIVWFMLTRYTNRRFTASSVRLCLCVQPMSLPQSAHIVCVLCLWAYWMLCKRTSASCIFHSAKLWHHTALANPNNIHSILYTARSHTQHHSWMRNVVEKWFDGKMQKYFLSSLKILNNNNLVSCIRVDGIATEFDNALRCVEHNIEMRAFAFRSGLHALKWYVYMCDLSLNFSFVSSCLIFERHTHAQTILMCICVCQNGKGLKIYKGKNNDVKAYQQKKSFSVYIGFWLALIVRAVSRPSAHLFFILHVNHA